MFTHFAALLGNLDGLLDVFGQMGEDALEVLLGAFSVVFAVLGILKGQTTKDLVYNACFLLFCSPMSFVGYWMYCEQ